MTAWLDTRHFGANQAAQPLWKSLRNVPQAKSAVSKKSRPQEAFYRQITATSLAEPLKSPAVTNKSAKQINLIMVTSVKTREVASIIPPGSNEYRKFRVMLLLVLHKALQEAPHASAGDCGWKRRTKKRRNFAVPFKVTVWLHPINNQI